MADSPPPMDFEEEGATADTTETVEEPQTEEPTPATLPTDSGEDTTTAAKPESSTALLEPTSTDDVPEEEVVHSKPVPAPAPAAPKSKVHDLFDDDEEEDEPQTTTTTTEQQVRTER